MAFEYNFTNAKSSNLLLQLHGLVLFFMGFLFYEIMMHVHRYKTFDGVTTRKLKILFNFRTSKHAGAEKPVAIHKYRDYIASIFQFKKAFIPLFT